MAKRRSSAGLATPPTKGFKLPPTSRLKFSPVRTADSLELDREVTKEGIALPPYERWDRFIDRLRFRQGDHVTLVGTTGSGKTTLARRLLPFRDYVVVLATKAQDPSLYNPLIKRGFEIVEKWNPDPLNHPKIIFRPTLRAPTKEGFSYQQEAFREALTDIFIMGQWCIYADEVRYLTQNLKLATEFELLWLQGRSLGISIIAATQRPVSIPLVAFDQAVHLFLWRNTDKVNIDRMSEFAGANLPIARYTIPRLPKHEVLYINRDTDEMVRTKVIT